ncbi:MAG: sugar phosphate isomerase/epimerase [Clostridiales bacterium]|nr:sugar phosphate isomerase/epimerase [Clostridiales bacterium]
MQIGISTASLFNRCDLEDTPPLLASYGATVCEVFLNTFCEYEEAFAVLLSGRIRQAGLKVYSVHPMGTQFEPQLFSLYHRQREDALAIFEKVLRAGQRLGARYYVMHGPASLGGAVKNMQLSRIGPIVNALCAFAARYGINLAWENVSWGLFHHPSFGPALYEAAKSEHLFFTLDIKQAARSGHSPYAYLDAMGDRMVNLHLCDYTRHNNRLTPALPGKGRFDFGRLREALIKHRYTGSAFFEVYSDLYDTDEEFQASYDFVKTQLSF